MNLNLNLGGAWRLNPEMNAKKPERTRSDSRFGEIPLLPVKYVTPAGKEATYWTYDLAYAPPMPKGAVRGDPRRQSFCGMCDVPKYFYVDEDRTCVECDKPFVFEAGEQKFWYEDLQFNFASTAMRCVDCRRRVRSGKSLQHQLTRAVRQAKENPADPGALLALTEASLAYFDRFQRADLDRALAAARKARRLSREAWEPLYWEARCHEAAGRPSKALDAYDLFLSKAGGRPRYKALTKDVEKRLR